jgi:NADP-dependent 3-hydroxy acid dehydrogenase YdfG
MSDFLNLRDQVIVITGAASGMGQAIARAAGHEGARLVLTWRATCATCAPT